MCHRGRPHEILFGKIAILLLERAINCTNLQYSEVVSKYFCKARVLLLIIRKGFLNGFTTVENTACLPVSVLNPPGTRPLRTIDLNSFPFPT